MKFASLTVDSPVEALAASIVAQQDVSIALAEGAQELEDLERATAEELGLTSEEERHAQSNLRCTVDDPRKPPPLLPLSLPLS